MEVKPVHLHLLLQIRPAIEERGQRAFLDLPSCLPLPPEHLWVEATVGGARQSSMKSTRALTSHCSRPSRSIQTSSSQHGCQVAPGRKHIPNWETLTPASSVLIRQPCGEFAASEGRITGRSLSCLCKVCRRQQQVVKLLRP